MDTRTNIPVDELQSIVGADNVREATRKTPWTALSLLRRRGGLRRGDERADEAREPRGASGLSAGGGTKMHLGDPPASLDPQ